MNFKKITTLLKLCLLVLVLDRVTVFCLKQTGGFSIYGISHNRPYDKTWEIAPLAPSVQQEVFQAIDQKFTYCNKGGQCFVFFSEDGRYVLKFLKQKLYKLPLWVRYFPVPYFIDHFRIKKKWKKLDKLNRDFTSYKIAYDELQNETGIIFIHLNQTTDLKKSLKIVDKLGIEHQIDLNKFDFILQKRADLLYSKIKKLMKKGKIDDAKKSLSEVLKFIITLCKKGIHDRDPSLSTNCGFIQSQPIKIDAGLFVRDERVKLPEVYKQELIRVSNPLKMWLRKKHPTLSPYFDQEIAKLIDEK